MRTQSTKNSVLPTASSSEFPGLPTKRWRLDFQFPRGTAVLNDLTIRGTSFQLAGPIIVATDNESEHRRLYKKQPKNYYISAIYSRRNLGHERRTDGFEIRPGGSNSHQLSYKFFVIFTRLSVFSRSSSERLAPETAAG